MRGKNSNEVFEELGVESVSDNGEVVFRFPGGGCIRFTVSLENVPYYRRLARQKAHDDPFSPPPTD